jgi:hypothetical protein
MSILVTNEVPTYDEPPKPTVRVSSHWNYSDRVVLEVGDQKVTVLAADLEAAIRNATNKGGI